MKELYKSIYDVLSNDTDLRGMVEYTSKKNNIRRGFQPEGTWNKLITFYFQPEYIAQDFTPMIRVIPLIVRVYDRENDLAVDDIAERVILLLDGANLSVKDKVYVYDSSYTGELGVEGYNDNVKSYEKVLRFELRFRVDAIAGTTGLPNRKRQIGRQGNE